MRRLLLGLVPLVLLAGCGDDGGKADEREVAVEVTFDEPLRLGELTWTVTVVNGTDDDVELTFGSGQRADVVLVAGGEEAYRWSRAQMFSQEIGEVTVPAGGERSFALEDHLEVDPGEYELMATVTATGEELTTTRTVEVQGR